MIPSNLHLIPDADLNALALDTAKRLQAEALAAAKEAASLATGFQKARHLKEVIARKCALADKLRKGSRADRIIWLSHIGAAS